MSSRAKLLATPEEPEFCRMKTPVVAPCGGDSARTLSHWSESARQWRHIGPPLRPVAADIAFFQEAVSGWTHRDGPPRVLLLGVTPELYRMPWPQGTDILAMDRSQAMIDFVWPGPKEAALCANWLSPPLRNGSRDIVLCDGGLHLISYPHEQGLLVDSLRNVLSEGGLCILRLFVPPRHRESPGAVLRDLLDGGVASPNLLKLRLGMAMMDNPEAGVAVRDVWHAFHGAAPDLEALAAKIGWSIEPARLISAYRDSDARYHFVTLDQAADLFCRQPGGFARLGTRVPSYELGERCPLVVFRRLPRSDADRAPMGTVP